MSVFNMNISINDPNKKTTGFDDTAEGISTSSYELAKNLRSHLGYKAACKTCAQNQWNGVLDALHVLHDEKSPNNEL